MNKYRFNVGLDIVSDSEDSATHIAEKFCKYANKMSLSNKLNMEFFLEEEYSPEEKSQDLAIWKNWNYKNLN